VIPPQENRRRRIGVIGTIVWDIIYGRDPRSVPVQEWGGIAYALAAFDAALPEDWELVPLIKVGEDLAPQAREWMRTLRRVAPDALPIEVPYPNNRVELRYQDAERRSEVLTGGVPGWTWAGLAPLLRDLDALYVNFISGWELDLQTAQLVRQHFRGPIYGDLHSLTLAVSPSGLRTPQPLLNVESWCRCFDFVQVNEDELALIAPEGIKLAAIAIDSGVSSLAVTLGKRGVIYFLAPGFENVIDLRRQSGAFSSPGPIRTALIPAATAELRDTGDPTGCGDVWGSTYFTRMVAGDKFDAAMQAANIAAARNVTLRGASGLAPFLRGELSKT
jgi:hypothetical protein